jgi:hypothetical protein
MDAAAASTRGQRGLRTEWNRSHDCLGSKELPSHRVLLHANVSFTYATKAAAYLRRDVHR